MVIAGLEDLLKDQNQESYSDPEDFVDDIADEGLFCIMFPCTNKRV
jgi:hypothetical protein